MKAILAILVAVPFFLTGCASTIGGERRPRSDDAFGDLVSQWIAPGDLLTNAVRSLESHGFTVREMQPGALGLQETHWQGTLGHQDEYGALFYRVWTVMLWHDGKTVKEVYPDYLRYIPFDL